MSLKNESKESETGRGAGWSGEVARGWHFLLVFLLALFTGISPADAEASSEVPPVPPPAKAVGEDSDDLTSWASAPSSKTAEEGCTSDVAELKFRSSQAAVAFGPKGEIVSVVMDDRVPYEGPDGKCPAGYEDLDLCGYGHVLSLRDRTGGQVWATNLKAVEMVDEVVVGPGGDIYVAALQADYSYEIYQTYVVLRYDSKGRLLRRTSVTPPRRNRGGHDRSSVWGLVPSTDGGVHFQGSFSTFSEETSSTDYTWFDGSINSRGKLRVVMQGESKPGNSKVRPLVASDARPGEMLFVEEARPLHTLFLGTKARRSSEKDVRFETSSGEGKGVPKKAFVGDEGVFVAYTKSSTGSKFSINVTRYDVDGTEMWGQEVLSDVHDDDLLDMRVESLEEDRAVKVEILVNLGLKYFRVSLCDPPGVPVRVLEEEEG